MAISPGLVAASQAFLDLWVDRLSVHSIKNQILLVQFSTYIQQFCDSAYSYTQFILGVLYSIRRANRPPVVGILFPSLPSRKMPLLLTVQTPFTDDQRARSSNSSSEAFYVVRTSTKKVTLEPKPVGSTMARLAVESHNTGCYKGGQTTVNEPFCAA